MEKNKTSFLSMLGITLLIISLLALTDAFRWIGLALSVLCLTVALIRHLSKN